MIYEAPPVPLIRGIDTNAFIIDSETVLRKDVNGAAFVTDKMSFRKADGKAKFSTHPSTARLFLG